MNLTHASTSKPRLRSNRPLLPGVDLTAIRPASWTLIIAFALIQSVLVALINFGVFGTGVLSPVTAPFGGWVQDTLIANLGILIPVDLLVLLWLGGLRPRDIGLNWRDAGVGFGAAALIWAGVQVVGLAVSVAAGDGLALQPQWAEHGLAVMLGAFVAQLIGNALHEEIAYRGFMLNHVTARLRETLANPRRAAWLGVLVSQTIFSLIHIPNRVLNGMPLPTIALSLLVVLLLGVMFALIYFRTGNLFLAVGVHALFNTPTSLFLESNVAKGVVVALTALVVILWPRLFPQASAPTERAA